MEVIVYLLQNTKLFITLVGGVMILAILWNLFEYSHNLITEEEKNNLVLILSFCLIMIVAATIMLMTK